MERPASPLTPFAWVHKRDGRLVPFEADKISRALFAASESAGRPDAFLARELTDSILHFLPLEISDAVPTTAQIAECVAKIVRELGQPALARIYTETGARQGMAGPRKEGPTVVPMREASASLKVGPSLQDCRTWVATNPAPGELVWNAGHAALRDYSLHEIFARDLVSAHQDGLLTLTGLEAPLELAGYVIPAPGALGTRVLETINEARGITSQLLVLDSPEYFLARLGANDAAAFDFGCGLKIALRLAHLQGVVNLNCDELPASEENLATGPLFVAHRQGPPADGSAPLLDGLLEHLAGTTPPKDAVRIDWHVSEKDFVPAKRGRLAWLMEKSLQDAPVFFAFDRSSYPVPLAQGLDRRHTGCLMAVHLHLARLIEETKPGMDLDTFLQKLVSLCRLALSAAVQKRDFVRRHSQHRAALTRGFLLERARLVVVPVGLWQATQMLTDGASNAGRSRSELARKIIRHLQEVLVRDGRSYLLDVCLDSPWAGHAPETWLDMGISASDPTSAPKDQLREAGVLHREARTGTATIYVAEDRLRTAEDMIECLRFAWQQTDVVRVRFVRSIPGGLSRPALWENGESKRDESVE